MSYHIIPHHTTSYHIIQHYTTSYHFIPHHTTSYHIIPCHTMSYHIIPCHTISYNIIPHHTTSYHVIPHHTMSYHIIPRPRGSFIIFFLPTVWILQKGLLRKDYCVRRISGFALFIQMRPSPTNELCANLITLSTNLLFLYTINNPSPLPLLLRKSEYSPLTNPLSPPLIRNNLVWTAPTLRECKSTCISVLVLQSGSILPCQSAGVVGSRWRYDNVIGLSNRVEYWHPATNAYYSVMTSPVYWIYANHLHICQIGTN